MRKTTYSDEKIAEVVMDVIAKNAELDKSSLSLDTDIHGPDVQSDSLGDVEVVLELERRFEIRIPDEIVDQSMGGAFKKNAKEGYEPKSCTVRDLVALVKSNLDVKQPVIEYSTEQPV